MNLKMKVKSYSFWVSLASAVILILKLVGQKFGFAVDEGLISDLFTSLCAILVLLGIIVVPSSNVESLKNESTKESSKKTEEKAAAIEQKTENANISMPVEPKKAEETVMQVETVEILAESEIVAENLSPVEAAAEFKFDLEQFIDKVCLKRSEIGNDILKFGEFLQGELENIKKNEN